MKFTPAPTLRFSFARLLLTALLTTALSGCFGGSRSLAPDYYLLTSREPPTLAPQQPFSIGVGPVRIAPFLARHQIVLHEGGGAMKIQSQRWGEPLEHGIQRALQQNLAALTGAQGRAFPWRQATTPDYAVRIDVTDLDRLGGNKALLEVNWVLEDLKHGRVITTQQTRLTANARGGDMAALVDAYSELLAQLATQIQRDIQTARSNPVRHPSAR